ncbi:MAG: CoA pyrophosphatase [Vitreoscilla sp.]|nr:CoA pyrophosphatase [Vitreoscilla sp.]MBP9539419.1 CoA pyrophosphatase [Vitreoscilla sp.]
MTDAFFDWSLWQRCVGQDLSAVRYPNLEAQLPYLQQLDMHQFRPAAVMVLIEPGDVAQVVLTVRSMQLHQHGGQVSFAGGKKDPEDRNLIDTALRETHEELGIPMHSIEVLGQMPSLPTVSAYHVVPVIGLLQPHTDMLPNEGEVAKVFSVPLAQLMQPERYLHYPVMRGNQAFQTVKFAHTENIWGATATILLALAEHYQAFVKENRYGVGGR